MRHPAYSKSVAADVAPSARIASYASFAIAPRRTNKKIRAVCGLLVRTKG